MRGESRETNHSGILKVFERFDKIVQAGSVFNIAGSAHQQSYKWWKIEG